ncbi:hypothetical protein [Mailhella sp.]
MAEGGRINPIMEQGEVCGQAVLEEENSTRETLCRDIPTGKILYLSDSYIFLNIITQILHNSVFVDF